MFTQEKIKELIQPICECIGRCKTDKSYESYLDSFGELGSTVDRFFSLDVVHTLKQVERFQNSDKKLHELLIKLDQSLV